MSGTDLSSARLVPVPGGEGWLARLTGAVVWVPGPGPSASELLAACLAAANPTELLGKVGSRLADPEAAPWPPFAIIASRGGELVSVVHGPVEVEVLQEGGGVKLYGGEEVGSWLNRALKGVTVVRAGKRADDDGLADLREGVVQASGFVLGAGPSPARTYRRAEPAAHARAEAASPVGAQGEADAGRQVARPASGSPGYETDAPTVVEVPLPAGAGSMVRGVNCPQGHFNDPRDASCRTCGAQLAPGEPEVVGPRPPLGRLTWDNGEVHDLSGATLVGRDVSQDEAVVAGELAALVPGGQTDSMSRVHAEIRADGWDVLVVDRGSTNGTFIWDDKTKAWQRLVPGEPQLLRPGTVLAFGERTATFEAVPVPVA